KQEWEFKAVSRVLAELEERRQSVEAELTEARAGLAQQTTQHQLVEDALAQWSNLAEIMASPDFAAEARAVRAALVCGVNLTFTQEKLPSGRIRSRVSGGTVTFKAEANLDACPMVCTLNGALSPPPADTSPAADTSNMQGQVACKCACRRGPAAG